MSVVAWNANGWRGYKGSPVNQNDSNDGGANIDSTNDGRVQESSVRTITQDVKELGGVEHDGVDAGELLEEGNQHSPSLQHSSSQT